LLRGA
jgi:Class II Aldolase and Adducin N-terminal domain